MASTPSTISRHASDVKLREMIKAAAADPFNKLGPDESRSRLTNGQQRPPPPMSITLLVSIHASTFALLAAVVR